MLTSLKQHPHPYTIAEWILATHVEPMYTIAQRTGVLAALEAADPNIDELSQRLGISPRGMYCMLNILQSAGILERRAGQCWWVNPSASRIFQQTAASLNVLVGTIESGLLAQASQDRTLPANVPVALMPPGIVELVDGQPVLTDVGYRYFVPGQESYLGDYVLFAWKLFAYSADQLQENIITGTPTYATWQGDAMTFLKPLAEVLFPLNYEQAKQVAAHLYADGNIQKVLDLAAGSGVWSIALAQNDPHIQADVLDLPPVLDVAQNFIRRYGLQSQFRCVPGDLFASDKHWGDPPYDVIYLCYIVGGISEEENQRILAACARQLRPGGRLVIADFYLNPDGVGPLISALFSAHVLRLSEYGSYPTTAYEGWLSKAGLTTMEWIRVPGSSTPILVARNNNA